MVPANTACYMLEGDRNLLLRLHFHASWGHESNQGEDSQARVRENWSQSQERGKKHIQLPWPSPPPTSPSHWAFCRAQVLRLQSTTAASPGRTEMPPTLLAALAGCAEPPAATLPHCSLWCLPRRGQSPGPGLGQQGWGCRERKSRYPESPALPVPLIIILYLLCASAAI